MFDILETDIVVMQETKIQRKDLRDDMVLVPGWDVYFSLPKYKKGNQCPPQACRLSPANRQRVGYSGVAIYTRNSKCCPIRAEEGITGVLSPPGSTTKFRDLPKDQQIGGYPRPDQISGSLDEAALDSEGRCVILEFPAFVLIGVYSPAIRDESRDEFRLGFINAMDARVRNLVSMGKEVILTGDLNIVRSPADTAGLQEQLRKENMLMDEYLNMPHRRFLNHLIFGGTVHGERDEGREQPVLWDVCREHHPNRSGMYTCWNTKTNARPGNYGSRIDYILCSSGLKDWVEDSNIQEGLLGSDHCPVYATFRDAMEIDGKEVHMIDKMNPEGMFRDGKRLREWSSKDLLPTSAKLIAEFDRRRSIRDMFSKTSNSSTTKKEPTQDKDGQDNTDTHTSTTQLPAVAVEGEPAEESFPPLQHSFSRASSSSATGTDTKSSLLKRQAPTASSTRPQKKNKSTLSRESSKSGLGKSQSSLMGFFKPKTPAPPSSDASKDTDGTAGDPSPKKVTATPTKGSQTPVNDSPNKKPSFDDIEDWETWPPKNDDSDRDKEVFDPIKSKESWSKLLSKRVPPKCEHGEPCISLLTKKPGVNCGK